MHLMQHLCFWDHTTASSNYASSGAVWENHYKVDKSNNNVRIVEQAALQWFVQYKCPYAYLHSLLCWISMQGEISVPACLYITSVDYGIVNTQPSSQQCSSYYGWCRKLYFFFFKTAAAQKHRGGRNSEPLAVMNHMVKNVLVQWQQVL